VSVGVVQFVAQHARVWELTIITFLVQTETGRKDKAFHTWPASTACTVANFIQAFRCVEMFQGGSGCLAEEDFCWKGLHGFQQRCILCSSRDETTVLQSSDVFVGNIRRQVTDEFTSNQHGLELQWTRSATVKANCSPQYLTVHGMGIRITQNVCSRSISADVRQFARYSHDTTKGRGIPSPRGSSSSCQDSATRRRGYSQQTRGFGGLSLTTTRRRLLKGSRV
jgi:hypothetical protein